MRLRSLDAFRFKRIEEEFARGTVPGAVMSILATVVVASLVLFELRDYLTPDIHSEIIMDTSSEETMRILFNITVPQLPCHLASIDTSDVVGVNLVNVTKHISKTRIDLATGRRLGTAASEPLTPIYADMVHDGEEHALRLNGHTFDEHLRKHELVLVNFFAPWCVWCQRLEPVWDHVAGLLKQYDDQAVFASVDCTDARSSALCKRNNIHAFPTIIVFRGGGPNVPDNAPVPAPFKVYHGDRTPEALLEYVVTLRELDDKDVEDLLKRESNLNANEESVKAAHRVLARFSKARKVIKAMHDIGLGAPGDKELADAEATLAKQESAQRKADSLARLAGETSGPGKAPPAGADSTIISAAGSSDRPAEGCNIMGFVDVNKVPGNFLITVHDDGHTLNLEALNLTHIVHSLAFGMPLTPAQEARLPNETTFAMHQLDNRKFVSTKTHTSHEHYVKVVGSQFWFADGSVVRTNKYSVNSHAYTSESTVAHAKFQYDLSPMTVVVRESRVPLYRFITSLCAIVGGAYTVMSLFDSFVDAGVNSLKKKVELGKAS